MKLNKYIWMLVLPMLVSACQDDVLVDNPLVQGGKFVLKASVDEGSSFSRAQIKLEEQENGGKYGAFQWDEGDKFRLFEIETDDEGNQSVVNSHDFDISGYSNSSPSSSATFVSETTPTVGNRFWAYYPSLELDEANNYITMTINQELQDNSADSWKAYFNNNMLMMAEGYIKGTETRLSFFHQCGLINVSYTNETNTAKYIKSISLDGDWGVKTKMNVLDPWSTVMVENASGDYGITFKNPVQVSAGETEDFFILFMRPMNYNEKMSQLSIAFTDATNSSNDTKTTGAYPVGMPTFYNGQGYRLNVEHTAEDALVWSKAPTVEGLKVSTPDELVTALSSQTKIALGADIALKSTLMIDSDITLDLAGYKLTNDGTDLTGFEDEKAMIVVKRGGHLTINDASNRAGVIEPSGNNVDILTSTIKMVEVNDAGTGLAELTINDGSIYGHHTISGTEGKGNTKIVINGGDVWAGFDGGTGVIHPQAGELEINGGEISGSRVAIEMGAGNLTLNGGRVYKNKVGYDKGIALYIHQGSDNLPLNVEISGDAHIEGWDQSGDWNGAYAIYDDSNNENVTISIKGTESNLMNGITGHIYSESKRGFIGSYTLFNSPSALSYIAAGSKEVYVELENWNGDYFGPAAYIPDSEEGNGAEVTVNLNGKTWTIESPDADNNYFYIGKNNTLRLTNGTVTVPEDASGVSLIKANHAELDLMNVTINSYNLHYAVDVVDGKTRFRNGEINAGEGCYAFNILSSSLDKQEPMFDLMDGNKITGNFKLGVEQLPVSTESLRAPVLYVNETVIDGNLYVSENITNDWLYYCVQYDRDSVDFSDESTGWNSVQNATDENLPTLPVYITDPNWIAVIKENYYGVDPYKQPFNETDEGYIDVNDETNKSIIEGMSRIAFSSEEDYSDIKELQHIERFVNLKYLDVLNLSVDSLNLSKNKSLEYVYLKGNNLTKLNLDSLQSLINLTCIDENLEVMPSTKGCTSLNTLSINMPKLKKLDLSNYQSLRVLHLTDTSIQDTLDLRAVTLLEKLEVWDGTFTSINLSQNANLEEILLYGEQALTSLDVTGCSSVSKVEFSLTTYNSNLTSFNAAGCTLLERVNIRSNNVPMDVNLDGCTSLSYAWLDNCKSLSLDGCGSLSDLWCHQSPELTTLDVSSCTGLTYLDCQYTGLTSLDLTGLTSLEGLSCDNCNITEIKGLDTGLTNLERLFCGYNQLTSINVKNLQALKNLDCGNNQITTLDLSGLTALTDVGYYKSPVTTLDISGCTALKSLSLNSTVKHLDITGCISLTSFVDGYPVAQMETVKLDTTHDVLFSGIKYLWGEVDSTKYPTPAHKQGYQYPVFTYSTTVE